MGQTLRFNVKHFDRDERESFVVVVHPEWAPLGAERFMALVDDNNFSEGRFYRVVPNFMAQFGVSGDPEQYRKWGNSMIRDDEVKQSNTRGRLSFAMRGPNTRSCQVFINFGDN